MLKSQNSNCETVDISSLESGVYILKVTMADGREFTERIVKL
ncbi:MAG: T9SS type A sorting domain-containing protein [Bacteroidales bacterium]|nr:T9SS type A sorting domain-containing protein [Bacteroidales bacterium]